MCGYEHFLTLMALNPEIVEELYDTLYAFQTRKATLCAEAGFDVVAVVGDIADQAGMMFSPGMFGRFDVPRFTALVKAVRAANPSIKVFSLFPGISQPPCNHAVLRRRPSTVYCWTLRSR
jgi:uroporphyrinogen-III decarboxylase